MCTVGDQVVFTCHYDLPNQYQIIEHEERTGIFEGHYRYDGNDERPIYKPEFFDMIRMEEGGLFCVPVSHIWVDLG